MPSISEHLSILELDLKCLALESMWRMAEVPAVAVPSTSRHCLFRWCFVTCQLNR